MAGDCEWSLGAESSMQAIDSKKTETSVPLLAGAEFCQQTRELGKGAWAPERGAAQLGP